MVQIGDSAYPLAAGSYPGSVQGWGFYIGGDTPHVWSDAEVAALPYRYRLPIYTCSDPAGRSGSADAAGPVAWLRAHHAPAGSAVGLDFEAAVDGAYVQSFDAAIKAAGYATVLYGQQSTVLSNPAPSGGYWVGDWDGVDDDPGWTGKQYEDTGAYDLSDFSPAAPLWDTQAATAATPKEDQMDPLFSVQADPANPSINQGIWWTGAGTYTHVPDTTDVATLIAAGAVQLNVSFAFHEAILAAGAARAAQIGTVNVAPPTFPAFQLTGTATPQAPAAS
jgi:hypothetical protein